MSIVMRYDAPDVDSGIADTPIHTGIDFVGRGMAGWARGWERVCLHVSRARCHSIDSNLSRASMPVRRRMQERGLRCRLALHPRLSQTRSQLASLPTDNKRCKLSHGMIDRKVVRLCLV